MLHFSGAGPVRAELAAVLQALAHGRAVETKHVDLKEEAGRRGSGGSFLPSDPRSEQVARQLAGEAACMANTPGGGALIVGVDDKTGEVIGTELETEWVRARIYELTDRRVTPIAEAEHLNGVRLVVLQIPQGFEPVPFERKYTWRVSDRCVPVDAASILAGRAHLDLTDVSARATEHTIADARPDALRAAREFLRAYPTTTAGKLAEASDADLLRRLRAMGADGHLTVAGALLFVGRDEPMLDYIRRRVAGEPAEVRLRTPGLSLLEVLSDVVREIRTAAREVTSVLSGLQRIDFPKLPVDAAREAIVNGLAHRDWGNADPTVVEHVGDRIVVQSPGGFVGGVTPQNIITHPSVTRNRLLADILSTLHVAEREGVGVDRMTRDMLRLGRSAPSIHEISGPYVRVSLSGGGVDLEWWKFLDGLEPGGSRDDLEVLLVLDHLTRFGWIDSATAAGVLQKPEDEALDVLLHLEQQLQLDEDAVLRRVRSVPASMSPVWTLPPAARARVATRAASTWSVHSRAPHAEAWAFARGRVSRAELAELHDVQPPSVNAVFKSLVADGVLEPSNPSGLGRGLYYRPVVAGGEAAG